MAEHKPSTQIDGQRGVADTRAGRRSRRTLVEAEKLEDGTHAAVLRIATDQAPGEAVSAKTRRRVGSIGLTAQLDKAGTREPGPPWFEDGFPDANLRHGQPLFTSRGQLNGIRSPSHVVQGIEDNHDISRNSRVIEPGERITYEMHIGAFTRKGDFYAAAKRLRELADRGITTVQVMPPTEGSGWPTWGYDPTAPGAIEKRVGGVAGLEHFCRVAHEHGIEVILDVVYNHRGVDQDSRPEFLPKMFERQTPWGAGLSGRKEAGDDYNHILAQIAEDMAFFARYVDGFRLDAGDKVPQEIRQEIDSYRIQLSEAYRKPIRVVAEVAEPEVQPDAQYAERAGLYAMRRHGHGVVAAAYVQDVRPVDGSHLKGMLESWIYGWTLGEAKEGAVLENRVDGMHTFRLQHDWKGNEPFGRSMARSVDFATDKVLLAMDLVGPHSPLVMMGEERATKTSFPFFTGVAAHNPALADNISAYYPPGSSELQGGRFQEHEAAYRAAGFRAPHEFGETGSPDHAAFRNQVNADGIALPDHANPKVFESAKLTRWAPRNKRERGTLQLFTDLARARHDHPHLSKVFQRTDIDGHQAKGWKGNEDIAILRRRAHDGTEMLVVINQGDRAVQLDLAQTGVSLRGSATDSGYTVGREAEWPMSGTFQLFLDTKDPGYGRVRRRADKAPPGTLDLSRGQVASLESAAKSVQVYFKPAAS